MTKLHCQDITVLREKIVLFLSCLQNLSWLHHPLIVVVQKVNAHTTKRGLLLILFRIFTSFNFLHSLNFYLTYLFSNNIWISNEIWKIYTPYYCLHTNPNSLCHRPIICDSSPKLILNQQFRTSPKHSNVRNNKYVYIRNWGLTYNDLFMFNFLSTAILNISAHPLRNPKIIQLHCTLAWEASIDR